MPTIPTEEQLVVPVLGMHRSGTSLMTRLLDLLGMDLGEPLQPPGPDNPMGFWENRLFQGVNIQLLTNLGANPDGFGSRKALYKAFCSLEGSDIGAEAARSIAESLRAQFQGPCWGFKDPRTVLSYPLWVDFLTDLGYSRIRPVLVLRRPEACVQSLIRRRDALRLPRPPQQSPIQFLLDIWRCYYRILLDCLDLEQCLVLAQEDLLDPDLAPIELRRMAAWLGTPEVDCSEALAWINPRMDHREAQPLGELDSEIEAIDAHIRGKARAQRAKFMGELPSAPAAQAASPEWSIYVVSPIRYGHSEAFSEMALTLHHAFARLGIEAPVVRNRWEIQGRPLVLGANLLAEHPATPPLPEDSILYNLEQVEVNSEWLRPAYIELLKQYSVWDYSPKNIEALKRLGVSNVALCEIGFVPELSRIPRTKEDIDILFYGSVNPRRRMLLEQLAAQGAKVKVLHGVYGPLRDAWIARSKIVLNVHFFEAKVLEIVRLSYLMSNGRFVVSERGKDADLEAPYESGMVLDNYGMLVAQCLTWLQHPQARLAIAEEGRRIFTARDQASFLRPLVQP